MGDQVKTQAQLMGDAIDSLLLVAERSSVIAHAKKGLFDAYVSEGFTKEQALELTKSFGGGVI